MTRLQWIRSSVLLLLSSTAACGAARTSPAQLTTQLDQPPDRGACPRPERPPNAAHSPGQDTVLTEFVLDSTGHVTPGTMHIVRSTDPFLNMAAILVVQRCHYTAARRNGRPIAVVIQQPVTF